MRVHARQGKGMKKEQTMRKVEVTKFGHESGPDLLLENAVGCEVNMLEHLTTDVAIS